MPALEGPVLFRMIPGRPEPVILCSQRRPNPRWVSWALLVSRSLKKRAVGGERSTWVRFGLIAGRVREMSLKAKYADD